MKKLIKILLFIVVFAFPHAKLSAQETNTAPNYEYAMQMYQWYGSADRSTSFQQAFENKSIIGYHIPIKPVTQEENVINKYSRLSETDNRSRPTKSNPIYNSSDNGMRSTRSTAPLSINQMMRNAGTSNSASTRRTYSSRSTQYSLALSPEQIRSKRAAIQKERETRAREEQRQKLNEANRARLSNRSSVSPYVPTSSSKTRTSSTQKRTTAKPTVKVYKRNTAAGTALRRVYDGY